MGDKWIMPTNMLCRARRPMYQYRDIYDLFGEYEEMI